MIATYPLPIYVQRFFTERLLTQMQASPNTIASYRDTSVRPCGSSGRPRG